MACWYVSSLQFNQVVRSGRVDSCTRENRVCTVSMNQQAASEEKLDEMRYHQL